ncbi:MAG: hypothetical protein GY723_12440, partial [bacterium]|nr:hypothetical protein [bacterium]
MRVPSFLRILTIPLLSVAILGIGGTLARADDQALFTTAVPPNVVLLVDNSLSMRNIVWHPAYDPNGAASACTHFTGKLKIAVDTVVTSTTANCQSSMTFYADPRNPVGEKTIYQKKYANWLMGLDPSDPTEAAILAQFDSANNGAYSSCVGGGTYSLYQRTRVTAAKDILRQVICQVNAAGEVRFGLSIFRKPDGNDAPGGFMVVPVEDYLDTTGNPNQYQLNGSTKSHGDHLDDSIDAIDLLLSTPLAQSLFQIYTS